MKGEQLHNLLISLSQAEKHQITRFLNRTVTNNKICGQLYRLMLDMPTFNLEEALTALYPGQQRSQARFESSCDYLVQQAITALAAKDPACQTRIPFIRKAMDKGMYKLAQKYLLTAMRETWEQERMEDLYTLSLIGRKIKRRTQVDINAKAKVPAHSDIFHILQNLEAFQEGLDNFALAMRRKDGSTTPYAGTELAMEWAKRLPEINVLTETEQSRIYKIQFWSHLALLKTGEAEMVQEKLSELTLSSKVDRIRKEAIKELGILIRMYLHNCKYHDAERASMRMMSIDADTTEDELIRVRSRITTGFMAAMGTGNVDRGREAIRELKLHELKIPESNRTNLYVYGILFSAYLGQWSKLLNWSNRFHSLPQKLRNRFTWQVNLVQVIAAIELKDMEMANTYLTRMRRAARNSELELPKVIHRNLQRIINAVPKEAGFVYARLQSELNPLMEVPAERAAAMFFDLRIWLDARKANSSIYEIAKAQNFQPFKEYLQANQG